MELESIAFDLREVVGDATQLLALRASEKGIDLDLPRRRPTCPRRCWAIPAACGRSSSICSETPSSSPTAARCSSTSGWKNRPTHTARLHCTVDDTGIGIPADKQQRIFESFSQADSFDHAAVRRHRAGTGDFVADWWT